MPTTNLQITYIDSAQAQKEVTANAAFDALDKAISDIYAYQMPADADATPTAATCLKCMVLKVTSAVSLTATRNITVPNNIKCYLVLNSTAGAQSIVVKTAAGAGITVPNGKEIFVRCNGTEVVKSGSYTGANPDEKYLINGTSTGLANAINVQSTGEQIRFSAGGLSILAVVFRVFSTNTNPLAEFQDSGANPMVSFKSDGNIDMNTAKKIIRCADPSSGSDVATKQYADNNFAPIGATYLCTSSNGSLTNEVNVNGGLGTQVWQPSSDVCAFNIRLNGGGSTADLMRWQTSAGVTLLAVKSTGNLDFTSTGKIVNLVDPTAAQDGATRSYVDKNAAAMLIGFGGSMTLSAGSTNYLFPWFITSNVTGTERWIPVPQAGKLSKLRVICTTAPTGDTVTLTVRKRSAGGGAGGGSDTALVASMTAGSTIATDLSNTVTIAAGDELSMKIVQGASQTGSGTVYQASMLLTLEV
jgi:hypothetical protein